MFRARYKLISTNVVSLLARAKIVCTKTSFTTLCPMLDTCSTSGKNIAKSKKWKRKILEAPQLSFTVNSLKKTSTFTAHSSGKAEKRTCKKPLIKRCFNNKKWKSWSLSCTTTRLSKLITECFKLVRSHCTAYCKTKKGQVLTACGSSIIPWTLSLHWRKDSFH